MTGLHEQAKTEIINWLEENRTQLKDKAYELGDWEKLIGKDRRVIERIFDEIKHRKIGPDLKIVPVDIKHKGFMLDPLQEGDNTLAFLGTLATISVMPVAVDWLSRHRSRSRSAPANTPDAVSVYDSHPLLYPLELDEAVLGEPPECLPTHFDPSLRRECPTFPNVEEI